MDILLIAVVFGALAALQSFLVSRFGLRGFSYRRGFEKKSAVCGDTVEFTEVIVNKSLLFLPWVRLETRIPPSFDFHTREEVDIRGGHYHKSVFTLPPYSQVTRRHRVKLTRRGHYVLTQASLTGGDLLGLDGMTAELLAPSEIYVYPALLSERELSLPSSRSQGDVSVPRWILPDPFLVNGIRGYRAGDAQRDIHWAATARMGELQVKTHDYTADPRLMVLINAQKAEEQWGELMEYEQERIERAISLAASLCLHALAQGVEAGFATNMPLDEEEECAVFPPSRGASRAEELLRAFACLRVRRVRSFPTFLDQLPPLAGMDVVILSSYDSAAIRERMELIRRGGGSAALYVLEDGHA